MQIINRIQNAMINANAAAMQGAMVAGNAIAHRDYPSFKPCDLKLVSKCSVTGTSTITPPTTTPVLGPVRPEVSERVSRDHGRVGRGWRHEHRQLHLPATVWATLVLNRQLCG